ncbi:unnamed protein product [Urochloa humidicola]
MGLKLQHWGVILGPRETMKCNPGEFRCHISQVALQAGKGNEDVRIFVKVDDKEILIGTLSDDKYPHYATELIFEKEFELRHTSLTRKISILGYKYNRLERKSSSSTEDGKFDEEVPWALPTYPNVNDDKSKETENEKRAAPKPATTQSSTFEETKDPRKLQTNVGGSDDDESDEDYIDSEEGESNDDEDSSADRESSDEDDGENFPKHANDKNRPAEKPLKTPPGKKAKMTTPSKRNNTGSGVGMRTGYVHVATPYPSKNVKGRLSLLKNKTPSTGDRPKQAVDYACESCSRTFYSYIALKTHCKVKKHKRSPH